MYSLFFNPRKAMNLLNRTVDAKLGAHSNQFSEFRMTKPLPECQCQLGRDESLRNSGSSTRYSPIRHCSSVDSEILFKVL